MTPQRRSPPRVTTGPIIEQLEDPRSPRRDRRLYELAVRLFKAIEAAPSRTWTTPAT
jgi:hypothetical protein